MNCLLGTPESLITLPFISILTSAVDHVGGHGLYPGQIYNELKTAKKESIADIRNSE